MPPLAACLTNPEDDSRTSTCRCQKNIICGYHRRMRSSAALTETCPSGTVRNTPFLRLEHEIRSPQPEGTKPPRRLRAKPPASQPAKRGGPPRFLSTYIRMLQGIPVLRRCHQGRRDNQWYIRKQGKSLRHSLMKDYRSCHWQFF